MAEFLCKPDHLWAIIGTLFVCLLVVGSGNGLGKLVGPALKRFIIGKSHEVTVNLGEETATPHRNPLHPIACTPENCTAQQAEYERSIANQKGLDDLREDIKTTNKVIFGKLDTIAVGITDIRVLIATFHSSNGGKKI